MKLNLFDFLVLLSLLSASSCFNLDVDTLVKYRGRTGSMFGFTVAQHSYKNQNWIIVGAPEDQSDIQPTVSRGGAVYRCDLTTDACEQVIFDRHGNNRDPDGNSIDSKSNQWFGATLTSSNGSVLASTNKDEMAAKPRTGPIGKSRVADQAVEQKKQTRPNERSSVVSGRSVYSWAYGKPAFWLYDILIILLFWSMRFFIPWISAWHDYNVFILINPSEWEETGTRNLLRFQDLLIFVCSSAAALLSSVLSDFLPISKYYLFLTFLVLYSLCPIAGAATDVVLRSKPYDQTMYKWWFTSVTLTRWAMAIPNMIFPVQFACIFAQKEDMSRQEHYNWSAIFILIESLNSFVVFWVMPPKCPTAKWTQITVWIVIGFVLCVVTLSTIITVLLIHLGFWGKIFSRSEKSKPENRNAARLVEKDGIPPMLKLKKLSMILLILFPIIFSSFVFAVLEQVEPEDWDRHRFLSATSLFLMGKVLGSILLLVTRLVVEKIAIKRFYPTATADLFHFPHVLLQFALIALLLRFATLSQLEQGEVVFGPIPDVGKTVVEFYNVDQLNRSICLRSEFFHSFTVRPMRRGTVELLDHDDGKNITFVVCVDPCTTPVIYTHSSFAYKSNTWTTFLVYLPWESPDEDDAEELRSLVVSQATGTETIRPIDDPQLIFMNTYVDAPAGNNYDLRWSDEEGPSKEQVKIALENHHRVLPRTGDLIVAYPYYTKESAFKAAETLLTLEKYAVYCVLLCVGSSPRASSVAPTANLLGFKIAEVAGPDSTHFPADEELENDWAIKACAPRYVYTQQTSSEERRDPVGTCWLSRDQLRQAQEFSPCRNRDWGYHRHGHCQAGLGAALSKDGGRLYIGSPGSCFWQGSVHSVAATTKLPFVPPKVIIIQEGKIHSQNTHNRADVISSSDGPYTDDDSYLGYSVTSGRFDGGLEAPAPSDIAVGVPKGERLNGKVVLFTYNMTHIRNITGEQLGAYFGYAMAACDIDADGYDDLIVGAPMYTEEGNHEGFYETGRIYVFYAGHEDDRHVREGDKNNRARFGHSIACLGDVNRDGYNDIAVGAPYSKDGEHGAVYIYHGSKIGLREKYSQVLKAEEIPGNPLTFGFSVAGGVDMDRNLYPDLTVGAYESNQAFLFKARPVVDMFSTVTFDSESKQISLEEKNCTLKDGSRVPCMKMDACLRYEGLGVEPRLDFEIQLILDARKPKSPRLAFLSQEGRNAINQTVRLDKGRTLCSSYWVYLKTNIKDKLTSLDAELWYSLTNQNRVARSLSPVLNANENLSAKDTLSIQKNCGRDNICIPDLRLIASPSVEKYVLGSGKRLEIEVEVQNEGEDAFESTFELMVPSGLNYVKIERKDEFERDIPVQCSPPSFNNNYTLHCDIGNPLPKDKLVKFLVLLQPYYQKTMNSTYNFTMSVNSTNPEKNRTVSDNFVHFGVPIWVVTELSISGSSRPVDVYYNSSQYVTDESVEITKESQIGPQVAHLYTITNRGPSEFLKAKATILWPSNTLNGEPLLYLLEPPETSGDIECHVEDDEYNVRKVKIERRKSFFDSELGETSAWSADNEESSSSSSSSGGGTYTKTSSSSSWSSSSSGSRAHLSKEERRRFEEEERRREEDAAARETGDGSHRHNERAKARVQGKNHYSRNGGKLESESHSRGSESAVRERGRTEYSRVPDVNSRAYEEEMYSRSSSSRTGGSGNGGAVVHTESRERTSVTTKGRGGGKTETTWREEKDGVVKSGSDVVHHGGATDDLSPSAVPGGSAVERKYEQNSTRTSSSRRGGGGSRTSWRVEGGGAAREDGGTLIIDDGSLGLTSSRRRGQGAGSGSRTAEERRSEWNTTWTSGGRPVTSEHTSWHKEQDGAVVGSGDRSRTYEGTYDTSEAAVAGTGVSRTQGGAYDERTSSSSSRSRGGASHDERISSSSSSRTSGGAYDERTGTSGSQNSGSTGGFNWRVEGEGMRREDTGAVATDGGTLKVTSSRRRGQGGTSGTKTAEERRSEWNTTWASGGRPVTSEHTSWRKEQDGAVLGSGEHSRTYEGTAAADRAKAELESRLKEQLDRRITAVTSSHGSTGAEIDENLIATGAAGDQKTYKKEWEEHYNTTWGTSTGGKPVTVAKTKWTVEEDGKVKTGGDTRTFEGVAPGTDGATIAFPSHSGGHHRTEVTSQGQGSGSSRHHSSHHEGRTVHGGSETEGDQISGIGLSESSRRTESRTVVSSHRGGSGGHHFSTEDEASGIDVRGESSRREGSERRTHGAGATSGSRTSTSFHRNEGESEAEFERRSHSAGSSSHNSEADSERWLESERREGGSESRYAESGRRTQHGHRAGESHSGAERRTHSGSSNVASSVGESSGVSSSFDFGAVARGPGDGKARTYVTDLGILDKGTSASGGSERASESASGSRAAGHHSSNHHSSRERHYSFGGEGGAARDEGSDSYSSSAARGAGSRSYTGEARYSSGSRTYSTGTRDIEGDPDLDPDYESRRAGSGSSSSSSSSWSSRSHSSQGGSAYEPAVAGGSHHVISNPDDRSGFRHYRRERRYVDDYDSYGYDEYEEDDSQKRCTGPVRCTRIICNIGALKKDQEVHVAVRSRLWVATVKKIAPHVETVLGSEMVAKVTLLPTIGRPSSKTMTKNSTEVKTRIMTEPVTQPDVVPLWIVVLSAVSGALILMLLVYILYKLGFFKRNRPEPASAGSEKTPLNRNGHYQGDEPL